MGLLSLPLVGGAEVRTLRGVKPALAVDRTLGGTVGGVAGCRVGGVADVAGSGREGVGEAVEEDVSMVTRGYL